MKKYMDQIAWVMRFSTTGRMTDQKNSYRIIKGKIFRKCMYRTMDTNFPTIDLIKTGNNIKKIMKYRRFTVKDVQRFLGLGSCQGIYNWINGKSLPTLDHIYALSELFQLPIDILLCGSRRYNTRSFSKYDYDRLYVYYVEMQRGDRNIIERMSRERFLKEYNCKHNKAKKIGCDNNL